MKHLKKYVNHLDSDRTYWLLPADDRLDDALKKIGCTLNFTSIKNRSDKYVFICFDSKSSSSQPWSWMPYEGSERCEYLDSHWFKYAGTVNIENFELEKNVDKYNL